MICVSAICRMYVDLPLCNTHEMLKVKGLDIYRETLTSSGLQFEVAY